MCLRNSRFVKGTQEDSHEAMRCIFDAIKNEEIEVRIYMCFMLVVENAITLLQCKNVVARFLNRDDYQFSKVPSQMSNQCDG